MTTKTQETAESMSERTGHAIQLEISKIVNVGLEVIVSSETKAAKAQRDE